MTSTSRSGSAEPMASAPHLVVLAEPPSLGLFVAEAGGEVPHLPRHGGPVLVEGPHHRRGALGTQGQVAVALVEEVVHLLADHLGALAQALEHPNVLEHGTLHQPIAGPPEHVGKQGQPAPASDPTQAAGCRGVPFGA